MSEQRNPRKPSGSEEEEERLFSSEPPRSFKTDRKSPLADKLKASVSAKLFEFLGNYSDDVLAEYIVVLVCNGKHQNQARADLEAFLGDGSGKFVAWLWNHLSEEVHLSKVALDSSSFKAKVSTNQDDIMVDNHRTSRLTDHQTNSAAISDILLSKNGKCEPSNTSVNLSKTIEEPESLQRWCPSTDVALTAVNTDVAAKQTFTSHKESSAPDYNCSGVMKCPSSRVRCSPECSSGGEHCLQYENQVQKIARSNSSAVTCQPLPLLMTEPVARSLRSFIAEDHQSKHLSTVNTVRGRLPSAAMDSVPHQIPRPRGNVWDRLGKPCNKDDEFVRQNQRQQRHAILERKKLDHNEEGLQKLTSVQVVPDALLSRDPAAYDSYGRAISNNHYDEHAIQDHNSRAVGTFGHADNSKRKKLFGEFSSGDSSASSSGRKENLIQFKQAFPKAQGSVPIRNNRLQISNDFSSEAKVSTTVNPEPACHPVKSSSTNPDLECDRVPQLNKRASVNIPMQNLVHSSKTEPVMSAPLTDTREANTNHRSTQDEVMDVKSRLHQAEMDMRKLRYKQADMMNDAKLDAFSGSQNQFEEDLESRTVLVTNVHFAASKEALLQHFTKCGPVLKVVLLTDTVTAQPKGAAYIVFASKESINKALQLSGSSFFSRMMKVMRKSEMPPGFLVPSQLVGKLPQLPQPSYPQSYKKGSSVQRQYTSSHLQWRRDQPASGETSLSVPSNGLGSSTPGET